MATRWGNTRAPALSRAGLAFPFPGLLIFVMLSGCAAGAKLVLGEDERGLWETNAWWCARATTADDTEQLRVVFSAHGELTDAGLTLDDTVPVDERAFAEAARAVRAVIKGAKREYRRKMNSPGRKLADWQAARRGVAVSRRLFRAVQGAAAEVADATVAVAEENAALREAVAVAEASIADAGRNARQDAEEADDEIRRLVFENLHWARRAAEAQARLQELTEKFDHLVLEHDELRAFCLSMGIKRPGRRRRPLKVLNDVGSNQKWVRVRDLVDGVLRVYEENMRIEDEAELQPVCLVMQDTIEDKVLFLSLDGKAAQRLSDEPPPCLGGHDRIPRVRLAKACVIVAVYDLCGMTSRMYCAMANVQPSMERFHVVQHAKQSMDADMARRVPIESLMASEVKVTGARVDFATKLRFVVELLVREGVLKTSREVLIKLSGDGRPVSRKHGHVMLTFAVMQEEQRVWQPSHNYTIAVFEGKEDYDRLAVEYQHIQHVVNTVKEMTVGDLTFQMRWVFSSDWKFLAEICGVHARPRVHGDIAPQACEAHAQMTSAHGACVRKPTSVTWKTRRDVGVTSGVDDVHMPSIARHKQNVRANVRPLQKRRAWHGCRAATELTWRHDKGARMHSTWKDAHVQFVPDTLHILLRVGDYLLHDMIARIVVPCRGKAQQAAMEKVVAAFRGIGIAFCFWQSQTDSGTEGARILVPFNRALQAS